MLYKKPPVTKLNDKFLGYCAVTPNKKFMKLFERAGVQNVLISYHYIRQNPQFTSDILKEVRARGGLFMTDSGAFSFLNDKSFDPNSFDWVAYLMEYANWLDDNKEYIFSACNLDVDYYVGHDRVLDWNERIFEPLEKAINIIYVAHSNAMGGGDLDAVKEYAKQYKYIAVNDSMAKHASSIYQIAKQNKCAVHGLAWTKPTILKDFPFFSVDSSTWVNYQKYGATPVWDGTNFTQYDKDNKAIRKTLKNQCEKYGVKYYEFQHEVDEGTTKHNDDEGLTFSLRTWLDVFQDIKKYARTKLTIPLSTMLDNKQTVFLEDNSTPTPSGKKGGILASLDAAGVASNDVALTTYQENEDGSMTALYDKREKTDITDFLETAGDSMVCNYCHVQDKCPKFKPDNSCAFNFAPDKFTQDPLATINMLIKAQTERVNRAMFFEKMEGGMPSKVFSQEMRVLNEFNNTKANMLLLVQGKGLRLTQTTIEIGTGEGEEKSKGGFGEMLKSIMGGNPPK